MRSSEVIKLIDYIITPNALSDDGDRTPVETALYANEFGMSLNSRLNAATKNLRIQGRVEIYSYEYAGQPDIEVGGVVYRILDASKRGDRMTLTYGEVMG